VYPLRTGGGIFCYNSGARLSYNKILNNHIPSYDFSGGGGVSGYPEGSSAHIILESNHIVNNTVRGDEQAFGSGVLLSCNGRLTNNIISYNTSTANGGSGGTGISCWSESPRTVEIRNNQITHNIGNGDNWAIGGGIEIEVEMNVSVIGNEISYNEVNGSGINGEFTRGGGIHVVFSRGTTIIDRNTISNNMVNGGSGAPGGGIALRSNVSTTLITNNIISGNSAKSGGGINSQSSKAKIINNTIVNNSADGGGGIRTLSSELVVLSTILWGNQAINNPQIAGDLSIFYSDVEGGIWEGEGNLSVDPSFEDSLLFTLSKSSYCVGNGIQDTTLNDIFYAAPAIDRYNKPRPHSVDEYVDMGAVESPYERVIINAISNSDLKIPFKFALAQNYPNPFNPKTNITFALPRPDNVNIEVYNSLGQLVTTLVNEKMNAGHYSVDFDASHLASGVYMYKIKAGEYQDVKKMILIK
jgi:hypothetical protein